MPLILASGSPRRKQLLECAAIQIDLVLPSRIPEERLQNESCCTRGSAQSQKMD